MRMRIRQVPCPSNSAISSWLPGADLADAFAVEITKTDAARGIETLARSVLGHPAPWFRVLLSIRDVAMRPLGVRSSWQLQQNAVAAGKNHIDFFRIIAQSDAEIVLGEDDRHLDFRASLLLRPVRDGERDELVATTVVRCHNLTGRIYLGIIAPFHRQVIRSNLAAATRRNWQ